jgi:hypothetical protein
MNWIEELDDFLKISSENVITFATPSRGLTDFASAIIPVFWQRAGREDWNYLMWSMNRSEN